MQQLRDYEIRCPVCAAGLLSLLAPTAQPVCESCGAGFAFGDGFLDLLPESRGRRTLAQVTMEWPPLIRIYESTLWRRSSIVARAMGIDFDREFSLITDAARLERGQRGLDLACGPGIYARPLAAAAFPGSVVGLDLSVPMLRVAAEKAREENVSNLLLVHGDAMELPFESDHFDVVNCCGALHLFPDADHVLGEVARVLGPGGRFTVAAFRRRAGAIADRLARFRRRIDGVNAFTLEALTAAFEKAGLVDPRCHHAARNGLIMRATKP